MIWRNNVRWRIREDNEPGKFMTVDSGDYMLAVPDFASYVRNSPELDTDRGKESADPNNNDGHLVKKVVMKLSGRVRWQSGIIFERNLDNDQRTFDFEPHYNVTLKNPMHLKSIKDAVSHSVSTPSIHC